MDKYFIIALIVGVIIIFISLRKLSNGPIINKIETELNSLEKKEKNINQIETQLDSELNILQTSNLTKFTAPLQKSNPDLLINAVDTNKNTDIQKNQQKILSDDELFLNSIKKEEKTEETISDLENSEQKTIDSDFKIEQSLFQNEISDAQTKSEQNKKLSKLLHEGAKSIADKDITKSNELNSLAAEKEMETNKDLKIIELNKQQTDELNKLKNKKEFEDYFNNLKILNTQIKSQILQIKKIEEEKIEVDLLLAEEYKKWKVFMSFENVEEELQKEEDQAAEYPMMLKEFINAYNTKNIPKLKQLLATQNKPTDLFEWQTLDLSKKIINDWTMQIEHKAKPMKEQFNRMARRTEKYKVKGLIDKNKYEYNPKIEQELRKKEIYIGLELHQKIYDKIQLEKKRNQLIDENKQRLKQHELNILSVKNNYNIKKSEINQKFEQELAKLKQAA